MKPRIVIDGVFYQLMDSGIGRLWRHLLEHWAQEDFGKQLVLLDRMSTMPRIKGLEYIDTPAHDPSNAKEERERVQTFCDDLGADLFISTYYTAPARTPSALLVYDMTPEVLGFDLSQPLWQEKHHAIRNARAHIVISQNTAKDLRHFFPDKDFGELPVAYPGVSECFARTELAEQAAFRTQNNLDKGYYLFIGARSGYKRARSLVEAFRALPEEARSTLVFTGNPNASAEEKSLIEGLDVRMLWVERDEDMRRLYGSATALVAPSQYEGFGMPLAEAMACGCPVIASDNPTHCEIGGEAFYRVSCNDVAGFTQAMLDIRQSDVREPLIHAGLEQVKRYNWEKMADTIKSVLLSHC